MMLVNRTDFDERFAAFEQLGRTEKDVESFELDRIGTLTPASNLRGRLDVVTGVTACPIPG